MCLSYRGFCIESVFSVITVSSMGTLLRDCFFPLVQPSLYTVFISVAGACFSPFHEEFTGGLPGFASHGGDLHLVAGWQWWKLLDVSGTQPPTL